MKIEIIREETKRNETSYITNYIHEKDYLTTYHTPSRSICTYYVKRKTSQSVVENCNNYWHGGDYRTVEIAIKQYLCMVRAVVKKAACHPTYSILYNGPLQ